MLLQVKNPTVEYQIQLWNIKPADITVEDAFHQLIYYFDFSSAKA